MSRWSKRSREAIDTLAPGLQILVHDVRDQMNIAVLCGNRNQADQSKAFADGKSQLAWPHSKHNQSDGNIDKSDAVDVMPYPVVWPDKDDPLQYVKAMKDIYTMAELFLNAAAGRRIPILWGGFFSFFDAGHFELTK